MSPGHGPHYWQECVSGHWDLKFGGAFASVFWGGEPEVRITAAFPNTGSCFNSNDFGYLGFLDVVSATKFVSRPVVSNIFFFEFSPGKNDPIGRSSQAHIFSNGLLKNHQLVIQFLTFPMGFPFVVWKHRSFKCVEGFVLLVL